MALYGGIEAGGFKQLEDARKTGRVDAGQIEPDLLSVLLFDLGEDRGGHVVPGGELIGEALPVLVEQGGAPHVPLRQRPRWSPRPWPILHDPLGAR